ncbi:MAG TPA: GNAT family N-acetyltransferase [Actinomycetales bacterium]|jgi:RimJ/RimL family protein N-acetyltransferase
MDAPRITDGQHPDAVVLRPLTLRDVEALVEACSDPESQRWTRSLPSPYRREDAVAFVARTEAGWARGSDLTLAVEVVDDHGDPRLAGTLSLRPDASGGADVGFMLDPWARGRGVMSRALRMMLAFGFTQLDLQVVHWQAREGNWPSRRVAWACGFAFEGISRGLIASREGRYDGWLGSIVRGDPMSPAHPWLSVPEVVGDGVRLRPWSEDDVPRVAEACSDPRTQQWLPQLPSPYRLSDAQWYVRSREEQHAVGRGLYWCVADADDDRCLGSVALMGLSGTETGAEVGYWAHPDARGRGVMSRAAAMAVRHAVLPQEDGGLGLSRVSLRAATGNTASGAVARAAGMTRVGVARHGERLRDGTLTDFDVYDVLPHEVLAP